MSHQRRSISDGELYELVEQRRMQWDALIWEVPLLSFTGQAFLFVILLGPNSAAFARLIAGVVSVGIAIMSMMLLARHRQAEQADAKWLSEQERSWPRTRRQHGDAWVERRNSEVPGGRNRSRRPTPRVGALGVPIVPGYGAWIVGHWILIAIVLCVVAVGFTFPDLLTGGAAAA